MPKGNAGKDNFRASQRVLSAFKVTKVYRDCMGDFDVSTECFQFYFLFINDNE